MKRAMLAVSAFLGTMLVAVSAFAEGAAATSSSDNGLGILGVMVGMALATFGGAAAQGKAAAAALEGIARNPGAAPKVQTPMIIGLALIESLVLFSLLIAFTLADKV